jgi:Hint domain
MPYLIYYEVSDFTWSDANGGPYPGLPDELLFGGSGGAGTADGTLPITITLNAGAVPQIIEVTDSDTTLDENVPTQTFDDNGTTTNIVSAYTLSENADGSGRFVSGVHTFTGSGSGIFGGYGTLYTGPVQGLVTNVANPILPGESLTFNGSFTTIGNEIEYSDYLPCFTKGTMIDIGSGVKAIEELEVGHRIWTRDSGMQVVRWIGSRHLDGEELRAHPEFRPVRFKAGSIGNDRDLLVSPEHRMLVSDARNKVLFGSEEVLVAARHLVDGKNVLRDEETVSVDYYHILFDKHEIVRANGAESESFHPSGRSSLGLDEAARRELFALFPDLRNTQGAVFAAARVSLKESEVGLLLGCKGAVA